MYSCIYAFIRPSVPGSKIIQKIVNDIPVRTLVEQNNVAYLVLTHPSVSNNLGLDLLNALDTVYALSPDITVGDWLIGLGQTALPTDPVAKTLKKGIVKYNDLINAGYDPQLAHPTSGVGTQLPDIELTDIMVSKVGADYEKVYRNCLFTVNGLLHIADFVPNRGVRITDGGRSTFKSKRNQLGILSFQALGQIDSIPVTRAMMKPLITDGKMKNGFTISIPDVDMDKKTVFLSIGGILHFAQHHYRVTGSGTIVVEWWKMPLESRYYNTKDLIDYTAFNESMNRNPESGDALDMVQAVSDESIIALMEMSQTFVILMDGDGFYFDRDEVEPTDLPGRYYTWTQPKGPLQLDNGFLPEYIAKAESEMWTIIIDRNERYNYLHDTRPSTADDYVSGEHLTPRPFEFNAAWMLELGRNFLA